MDIFIPKAVSQFDGSACERANCGAAATSVAIQFARKSSSNIYSGSHIRALTKRSCVATPTFSGGLYSSDIELAVRAKGEDIDFNRATPTSFPRARTMAQALKLFEAGYGGVFLGDYDALENTGFEVSESFQGDHWAYAQGRFDNGVFNPSWVRWYDPIVRSGREQGIWMPTRLLADFWINVRKNTELPRGLAGFVGEGDSMLVGETTLVRTSNKVVTVVGGTDIWKNAAMTDKLTDINADKVDIEYYGVSGKAWAVEIETSRATTDGKLHPVIGFIPARQLTDLKDKPVPPPPPPVDPTPEIEALRAQVAALTAEKDVLQVELDTALEAENVASDKVDTAKAKAGEIVAL